MAATIVFDAYGTLFDLASAARRVAAEPGRSGFAVVWPRIAADWRRKQLEYTWLRAITGAHADFWTVTRDALDWSLEAAGMAEHDLRERLLALYWELEAFPEVPRVLDALRAGGHRTAILSNGTPEMLAAALASAGLAGRFDATLSVESAGAFKPASRAYDLIGRELGVTMAQVVFVSSNGWDAAAASGYGLRAVWVNRTAKPMERLPWRPAHVLGDFAGLPELLEVT